MKIPVYTAQGGATTQAPGRSMNVRMNAAPFVNAALQQGAAVAEVASQVGQYAETRYKVITETKLNEALLGAEETLRTRADELSKSGDYGNILDGENPVWQNEVTQIKERLRDEIGGNVYALQQFDARFGQIELSQRFALRGEIDRKIAAAAAAARKQRLVAFEDSLATGQDIGAADLAARSVGVDSERWAASGAGNPEALTAQEAAALKRGTYRSIQNMIDNSTTPEKLIDNLRVAIRNDDMSALASTPEAVYAYTLLQRMPYSDRQEVLGPLASDVAFFNAPTAEEQAAARLAAAQGEAAGDQAAAFSDQLSNGIPVPPEAINIPRQQLAEAAQFMTADQFAAAEQKVLDFEYINGVAQSLNRVSNPDQIRQMATQIMTSGINGQGVLGIDTDRERGLLDFLSSYEANMRAAIDNGDILDWARSTGAVKVGAVNLSPEAITSGETGIAQRDTDRLRVAAHYGIDKASVPVFSQAEAAGIVDNISNLSLEAALATVSEIQVNAGQRAVEDLRSAGLAPEIVEMMYQTNPLVQRELFNISKIDTTELKRSLPSGDATDVTNELATVLSDYRAVFTAGGDDRADKIFNEQFAVAEKLALSRLRKGGDPISVASRVIEDIFPPQSNWVNTASVRLVVSGDANPDTVETALSEKGILYDGIFRSDAFGIVPLDNPLLPEFADREVSILSLQSSGVWLNNSTGDGAVLHYNINGEYFPALANPNGSGVKPVEIKFSEAKGIVDQVIAMRQAANPDEGM